MSKVQLQGNASGTGIFTIASPNSNTDRTLTLPDNTGTLLSNASSIVASQLPNGSVIQVVSGTIYTDRVTITSASFTNVGGVSITPSSSTSKIMVFAQYSVNLAHECSIGRGANANLSGIVHGLITYSGSVWAGESIWYLDSPASTSSQTYYLTCRGYGGNATSVYFGDYSANGPLGYMVLMEIKA